MNRILYKNRCKCKELLLLVDPPKKEHKTQEEKEEKEEKPAKYATLGEVSAKTFQIIYDASLSLEMKLLLNSFQQKYLYYAIDDILQKFQLSSKNRNNLLAVLYSPSISLHNSSSVDFFDIWIHELYVDQLLKVNRFLTSKSVDSYQITITILYKKKNPKKVKKTLW